MLPDGRRTLRYDTYALEGTLTTRSTPCVMNFAAGVTSQFVSKILLILRSNPLYVQWAVEMRKRNLDFTTQTKKSTVAPITRR